MFPVLIILLAGALGYQLLAMVCLWRFFSRSGSGLSSAARPGVTVFKPVKGLEAVSRDCLESFLRQDYPSYQVIFGVAEAQDPILPLLRELQQSYPQRQVEVVICPDQRGRNPKVSTLCQLEPQARYDLWVIADGDVLVGRDFLATVVAALQEPGVGVVSCLYRSGRPRSVGAWLEALSISADFIPSVAVARYVEGIRFALGAAMATSRQALDRSGGFAALADYLADDYQLGWRAHQSGYQVRLLPYVVETWTPTLSFQDYFLHQLRWARTYRVCRPLGYLAYGITHALVFSLALVLATGGATFAWACVAGTLATRLALAWFSHGVCLGGELPAAALVLLPLKDGLAFFLWLFSFLGNRVSWEGSRYSVSREGKLTMG